MLKYSEIVLICIGTTSKTNWLYQLKLMWALVLHWSPSCSHCLCEKLCTLFPRRQVTHRCCTWRGEGTQDWQEHLHAPFIQNIPFRTLILRLLFLQGQLAKETTSKDLLNSFNDKKQISLNQQKFNILNCPMKPKGVTTQTKALGECFLMVVFTLLLNRVHVFENVMFNLKIEKHGSERATKTNHSLYCTEIAPYEGSWQIGRGQRR